MIFIYIIKLTDQSIYIYHNKNKQLIKKEMKSNIIKENKVYDVKKLINFLNSTLKENVINNNLFKTKVYFLLSKNINPSELFCFEYAFSNTLNIKYKVIYEESLLKEKNEIIIWEDYMSINLKTFPISDKKSIIKNLKNKNYILIGDSLKWNQHKAELEKILNNKILEYENSNTILFERV